MNQQIRELEKQAIDSLRHKSFSMEQFRELAERADILFYQGHIPETGFEYEGAEVTVEDLKKFAELIVRKCLEQVRDEVQYEYDWKLADAVSKRVLEHFGFKEPQGWGCPKCGVDRIKASCPQGHTAALTGDCPMYGIAL